MFLRSISPNPHTIGRLDFNRRPAPDVVAGPRYEDLPASGTNDAPGGKPTLPAVSLPPSGFVSPKKGKRICKDIVSSPMGFVYVCDCSTATPSLSLKSGQPFNVVHASDADQAETLLIRWGPDGLSKLVGEHPTSRNSFAFLPSPSSHSCQIHVGLLPSRLEYERQTRSALFMRSCTQARAAFHSELRACPFFTCGQRHQLPAVLDSLRPGVKSQVTHTQTSQRQSNDCETTKTFLITCRVLTVPNVAL
jgi:hypothetical protein